MMILSWADGAVVDGYQESIELDPHHLGSSDLAE